MWLFKIVATLAAAACVAGAPRWSRRDSDCVYCKVRRGDSCHQIARTMVSLTRNFSVRTLLLIVRGCMSAKLFVFSLCLVLFSNHYEVFSISPLSPLKTLNLGLSECDVVFIKEIALHLCVLRSFPFLQELDRGRIL